MIRNQLEVGKAFMTEDVKKIMNDKLDVHAREVISSIIKIALSNRNLLKNKQD